MSDENAIAPVEENLPATTSLALGQDQMLAAGYSDEDYAGFASGFDFLPRLTLCGASTNLCKEGKQPIGTYALVYSADRHGDLGKQTNVFVLGMRLKALEIAADGIFNFFDPKSPEFARVANLSQVKDSGCLAGPEFLVYVPSTKEFATFFMASKSMRNEAPSLKALLGKAATLQISLAENKKKQKWHVPKALPCTIPLSPPSPDALTMQLNKFRNPVSSQVKTADAPAGATQGGTAAAASDRPQ